MNIDKGKIQKRFSEINESVSEIQGLASLKDEEFWTDKKNLAALKYYLLQAIEAVGNICAHIAAKSYNRGVSSFGECFDILEEKGILKDDLASRLRNMVKFRNKLIHHYWNIDDKKVLEYVRKDINDFTDFIIIINNEFLDKQ